MILLIVIDDVRKQLRLGLAPLKSLCVVKQVEQGSGKRSDVRSHRFAVTHYRGKGQIAQLSVFEV